MRVRLHFTRLSDERYARRLEVADTTRPKVRTVLAKSFKDDAIVVSIQEDHGSLFTTTELDENGEALPGATTFSYQPGSQAVAPDAASLTVTSLKVVDDERPDVMTLVVKPDGSGTNAPLVDGTQAVNGASVQMERTEVRVAPGTSSNPHEAVEVSVTTRPVSEAAVTETALVPIIPDQTTQTVFARKVDEDSGREGAWVTEVVPLVNEQSDFLFADDFKNDFGNVSAVFGTSHGVETVEMVTSHLVHAEVPSMFADAAGTWTKSLFYESGDEEDVSLLSMNDVFPIGIFTAPEITQGDVADFIPSFFAEPDDYNRGADVSLFSDEASFDLFRPHDKQLQSRDADQRHDLREDQEDTNWLATTSNGAPLRTRTFVKKEAGAFEEWFPGQRVVTNKYTAKLWTYAHKGVGAPKIKYFWNRRWRRNRKWEYDVIWEPTSTNEYVEFTIPSEVVTVLAAARIEIGVRAEDDNADVSHGMNWSISGSVIRMRVTETQRVVASSVTTGAWSWTYPRPFQKTPALSVTPKDGGGGVELLAGYDSASKSSASGYAVERDGTAPTADVDIVATGLPEKESLGGDVHITIQIMGA